MFFSRKKSIFVLIPFLIFLICPWVFASLDCSSAIEKLTDKTSHPKLSLQKPIKAIPIHEEKMLREEGFSEKFTAGLDAIKNMIVLRKNMEKLSPRLDPYKTHIPYFADLIPIHVEWIRKGLNQQEEKSNRFNSSRYSLLDSFYKHALSVAKGKKLTYAYWILWNEYLSNIAIAYHSFTVESFLANLKSLELYKNQIKGLKGFQFNQLMDQFPDFLALSIPNNELGFITLNRAADKKFVPIRLVNDDQGFLYGKGVQMRLSEILIHDITPTRNSNYGEHNLSNINENYDFLSSFKKEQREIFELILFYITHETPLLLENSLAEVIKRSAVVQRNMTFRNENISFVELLFFQREVKISRDIESPRDMRFIKSPDIILQNISDKYLNWFNSVALKYFDNDFKRSYSIPDLPMLNQAEQEVLNSFARQSNLLRQKKVFETKT